jgi:hypothetical protein
LEVSLSLRGPFEFSGARAQREIAPFSCSSALLVLAPARAILDVSIALDHHIGAWLTMIPQDEIGSKNDTKDEDVKRECELHLFYTALENESCTGAQPRRSFVGCSQPRHTFGHVDTGSK